MNSANNLINRHCVPCEGGVKPLTRQDFNIYLPQVANWKFSQDDKQMYKSFVFANFGKGIEFMNEVANLAENEGHHPDMCIHDFKQVTITLWTHAIGGLSINDFVMATKIDTLL